MLLQELKKAFSNKMFQAVVFVSVLIPFMNTYVRWKAAQMDIAMGIKMQMEEWVCLSVFSGWIGSESYTSGYSLFFYLSASCLCRVWVVVSKRTGYRIHESDCQSCGKEEVLFLQIFFDFYNGRYYFYNACVN